jgi:hypothetical protein
VVVGFFGAAACVAAVATVAAQNRAHTSAPASEVLHLIGARIVTLRPARLNGTAASRANL